LFRSRRSIDEERVEAETEEESGGYQIESYEGEDGKVVDGVHMQTRAPGRNVMVEKITEYMIRVARTSKERRVMNDEYKKKS
jgi:hypothetical protein